MLVTCKENTGKEDQLFVGLGGGFLRVHLIKKQLISLK